MKKLLFLLIFLVSCNGSESTINSRIEIKAINEKITELEKMIQRVQTQEITEEMVPVNEKKLQSLNSRIDQLKKRRAEIEGSN